MRCNSIAETIGKTPLVKLNRIVPASSATVYVKMESLNPGGSVKDRIGLAMIETAEREGRLRSGMTIVEPTSGNTGIGLAMVAAALGYRAILVMPETMSAERRALLSMYGAELILTPGSEGMKGAIARANEIAAQDGHFMPMQFSNQANPEIHRRTTALEIINDLDNVHLDAFVAGVGTGGSISGGGEILKNRYNCRVVAVEPDASPVLSGGDPGPHPLQGIGAGFVPDNYNGAVVDEIMRITGDQAMTMARRLAREEGLLAGISSGANVSAALEIARRLGTDATVVTFVCDTGERYVSTPLFTENG